MAIGWSIFAESTIFAVLCLVESAYVTHLYYKQRNNYLAKYITPKKDDDAPIISIIRKHFALTSSANNNLFKESNILSQPKINNTNDDDVGLDETKSDKSSDCKASTHSFKIKNIAVKHGNDTIINITRVGLY